MRAPGRCSLFQLPKASSSASYERGRKKPETGKQDRDKNRQHWKILPRFLTSKSESYMYENLRLKKNSLPSEEFPDSRRLIPSPKTPRQPKEVLQKSIIRLKSSLWTESVAALRDIVQISRFNPRLIEKNLPAVYKEMTHLLNHSKKTVIRTTCQSANEIFSNVPPLDCPELENLVCELLQKSAETQTCIRGDANEALDSLVLQIPPQFSIKILLNKRMANLNPNAKATASKLLVCAVNSLGTKSASTLNKDLKTRLVNATVRLLQDECFEIKEHGMNLVTMFMRNEEFTDIFHTKFSNPILKKVIQPGIYSRLNKI